MYPQNNPSGVKRKMIDDFFNNAVVKRANKVRRAEKERADLVSTKISGLDLILEFVSKEEEATILRFLEDQEWRTDLARRVIHYGGTYCLLPPRTATHDERKAIENTIIKAEPIPSTFGFLIARMVQHNLFEPEDAPEYCIVNEYKDNQGISAHVENFKFISPVCGLTLGNGDWIRFHELTKPDDGSVRSGKAAQASRTGKKVDVWLPSRSLMVMSGESREKWQHEIMRSRKGRDGSNWRRVSLTFRAERKHRQ